MMALTAWGGPAPFEGVPPTLAVALAALPPEGALKAWDGPAPFESVPPTLAIASAAMRRYRA